MKIILFLEMKKIFFEISRKQYYFYHPKMEKMLQTSDGDYDGVYHLHCNFPGEIFHRGGFSLPSPAHIHRKKFNFHQNYIFIRMGNIISSQYHKNNFVLYSSSNRKIFFVLFFPRYKKIIFSRYFNVIIFFIFKKLSF